MHWRIYCLLTASRLREHHAMLFGDDFACALAAALKVNRTILDMSVRVQYHGLDSVEGLIRFASAPNAHWPLAAPSLHALAFTSGTVRHDLCS